jgi:hypothetical protein
LTPASHLNAWKAMREASINRLAKEVEQSLDMDKIFTWAGCVYKEPISESVLRSDAGVLQ